MGGDGGEGRHVDMGRKVMVAWARRETGIKMEKW